MIEPTTDRPTDPIRDAFEAMLAFLACLIGPLRPRKLTPAEEIGAAAACEAETDFEPDEPPAPLLALRDLVTRAAEEHNRRALDDWHAREQAKLGGGDFTPERISEARERCEKATPGPWVSTAYHDDDKGPHVETEEEVEVCVCALDVPEHRANGAFISHAREDLPAALAEIKRLTAELAARAPADEAAELQEIREWHAMIDKVGPPKDATACHRQRGDLLAMVDRLRAGMRSTPADASLEARAEATRALWWRTKWIDAPLPEWAGCVASEKRAWIAVVDASRPGLTEEQAAEWAREMAETNEPGWEPIAAALLRASRGETGPAPTWGEQAIAEHRRAADLDPRATLPTCQRCKGVDWSRIPDSLAMACKGCGAVIVGDAHGGWEQGASLQEWAADLAAVDRQRATLHAGDPASVPPDAAPVSPKHGGSVL